MFGFGESSTPQNNLSASSSGSAQEKISTAVSIISMMSCQDEAQGLQSCLERNRLSPTSSESQIRGLCGQQFAAIENCASRVEPEQVMGVLAGVAEQECPSIFSRFAQCIQQNGQNPTACERQLIASFECASDHILQSLEEQQQSAPRGRYN